MTDEEAEALAEFKDMCVADSRNIMRELAGECSIKDFDEDACTEVGNVCRPLVLVRGKPITRGQVMQLVTGEEPLFGGGSGLDEYYFDPRESIGILRNIFYRGRCCWLSTWVYSDGTIGGDLDCMPKYPAPDKYLPKYIRLAGKYPFLDAVFTFTTMGVECCFRCDFNRGCSDQPCKCQDCVPYLEKFQQFEDSRFKNDCSFEALYYDTWEFRHVRSDIADFVKIVLWVHDGRAELLFRDAAVAKFNEYNGLYCAPEYDFMFSDSLYRSGRTCICSKEFVGDCFEYTGKPRSLCDEYVKRGFISPFNEDEVVVTREWAANQYNTFIAGK